MKKEAQEMQKKDVPKKVITSLLLVAIILAIAMTMYFLNYFQTPKAAQPESKESSSGGEISLTVREPPTVKDESQGSVSLILLPSVG